MDEKKIGKFIKEKRIEKGLTQQALAEKLFVSNKTVSKWELGKCMPSIDLLKPLCKTLGIDLNELLEGENIVETKESYEQLLLKELRKNRRKKYDLLFGMLLALFLCLLETILYIGHITELGAYGVFFLVFFLLLLFAIYEWLVYKKK